MKSSQDRISAVSDEHIEKIVEELVQQDVLPIDDEAPDELNPLDVLEPDDIASYSLAGSWGQPVGGEGHRAPRVPLEDENKASDLLAQRGATEAADELEEMEQDEVAAEEVDEMS